MMALGLIKSVPETSPYELVEEILTRVPLSSLELEELRDTTSSAIARDLAHGARRGVPSYVSNDTHYNRHY